jgi:arylformamidase
MTQTPDFYEREYNNRAAVPEHPRYFQQWIDDSIAAREQLTCYLDLAYGSGEKETLDLFPAPKSDRLLVFIHGGYWRAMDKRDFSWIARSFVEAGISTAALNYGLCPTVSMETIVEQCRRAIAWLYTNGQKYGVHGDRQIITGHSAGGHLTAMMYATEWVDFGIPPEMIIGGVAISGLFDLEPLRQIQLNADLRLDEDSGRQLSPIYLQPRVQLPMVVCLGTLESSEYHRQSREIAQAWTGVSSSPVLLENCHHFNVLEPFTDLDSSLWRGWKHLLFNSRTDEQGVQHN